MKKMITLQGFLEVKLFSLLLIASFFSQAQSGGAIYETGPLLSRTKIYPVASTLSNGKIISFGGRETGFVSSSYADIYDPSNNTFSEIAMNYTHDMGAVAKLADGRFFIIGGGQNLGVPAYATTEIYDPVSNVFIPRASMWASRMMVGAVQLAGGDVLVAGAWYNNSAASYGELYDVETDVFTATSGLISPRAQPILFPTSDGGAVIAGGWPSYGGLTYTSTEYYDPTTNNFSVLNSELIPDDAGWLINSMYTRTFDDAKMNNGKYLMLASRSLPIPEFALIEFDPSTKLFTKITTSVPLLAAITDGGFFDIVQNKADNFVYLLGYKASTDPWQICLVSIDLSTGQVYYPLTSHTLAAEEYLNPAMTYIPSSGKIMLQGVSSYPDNFNATNKTFLLTPQLQVGILENSTSPLGNVTFYPNPSSDLLTLKFESLNTSNVVLNIYNMVGEEVFVQNISNKTETTTLDISKLATGIYFLHLSSDNQILYDRKIVVAR